MYSDVTKKHVAKELSILTAADENIIKIKEDLSFTRAELYRHIIKADGTLLYIVHSLSCT